MPVNFVPPDELLLGPPAAYDNTPLLADTPLLAAVSGKHEHMALCLLSLPRGDHSPPLNLNERYHLLTMAADAGMVRAVKALLALSVDLLARNSEGHLAVYRAVRTCQVEVADVLLEAHATQGGDMEAMMECSGAQDKEERAYRLLFHAIDCEPDITPEARLAMVRCLVHKWGADVQVVITAQARVQYCPLFAAALAAAHNVVAFFLDECDIDVNTVMPLMKDTVVHFMIYRKPPGKREAVRMFKYLLEEKGADYTLRDADGNDALDLALGRPNCTYAACIRGFMSGTPINVDELASSDEWNSPEKEAEAL